MFEKGRAACKKEGVDIGNCAERGYGVAYTDGSEWLNYTINVAAAGSCGLDARVAALADGARFHFKLNGLNSTTLFMLVPQEAGKTRKPFLLAPFN